MDWTTRAQAEGIERRAYRTGWWWGFSSGLIVGCCSAGLLATLLWVISNAMACPQC